MPPSFVQRIAVPFEYPVYFTHGVFDPSNGDFAEAVAAREPSRRHRLFVVVDLGVADAWPALADSIVRYVEQHAAVLELAAPVATIAGGEVVKNDPAVVPALHARFDALRIDRQSFVVAVGGGAVLDTVGYAAATAHRGVRFVRVPTTVLAQADSGVGVKNGINALGKKNFLGTFAPPFAVLVDPGLLRTLGRRDCVAGMAEAVKVSLLRDELFFHWIGDHTAELSRCDPESLDLLVHRCAELHLAHIATSGDPFEFGSARPLDFGHWAAHKLESMTDHELRHGEAVAIGLALDTIYSQLSGLCDEETVERVLGTLGALGLALYHPALARTGGEGRPEVLEGLAEFREHLGGELTVTLLRGIGRPIEVHAMELRIIEDAIDALRRHAGGGAP